MGRKEGSPHHNATWPEHTLCSYVVNYATGAFSNALILFVAAERAGDTEQMTVQCKAMRSVVTRIDQFRRMRIRQWQVPQASSPKSSSPAPASQP